MSITSLSYAAPAASVPLAPFTIDRRALRPKDVSIDILYCGVCHSDVHQARDEWGGSKFPMVPGHEIVGRIAAVGPEVKGFKVGDTVGVGCMVDSCRTCAACQEGVEQYCEKGFTGTYNGKDRHDGSTTYGGYSSHIVVDEAFVLRVSDKLPLNAVAPLLCAGITTYSPLRFWKVGPGDKVGVVGLGGLGHMAVKIANAMGAHVVLFTTSPSKVADAVRLGAKEAVISNDKKAMSAHLNSFDFIIDCVSAPHDLNAYMVLLKREGTMTLVGVPDKPPTIEMAPLVFKRRHLAGSLIGGVAETQEMLDFCAEHGIVSDVEVIDIKHINEAYDRMVKSDVKYRFVIDIATLKAA
ncbi:NAD(P)-dependent alcohol dehydrogenase [uncultured Nevskia sp.]|uniref:NAD(P)-dependent alcohol dehydrogenase n=1 Tax=uncultured Nevskia sp. TaxID=228950 RepID=UPI0025DE249D|nr:NAD(P)-dependent alcohol dehydrogenase [uncultured Nevskia sp.]